MDKYQRNLDQIAKTQEPLTFFLAKAKEELKELKYELNTVGYRISFGQPIDTTLIRKVKSEMADVIQSIKYLCKLLNITPEELDLEQDYKQERAYLEYKKGSL